MTVTSTAGAKLYIGPASPDADDATEWAALTPWVEVGSIEDLGEFGGEAEILTRNYLGQVAATKLKGARDNGTMSVVVGRDALDPGQIAMRAAEQTEFPYAFKVELDDRPAPGGTDSVYYFAAIVASAKHGMGEANNVTTTTFALGISGAILEVPATAGT